MSIVDPDGAIEEVADAEEEIIITRITIPRREVKQTRKISSSTHIAWGDSKVYHMRQ